MPSLNRVELIGHLGRDPEMRYTTSGKPVTSCSLAVSGPNDTTEWVNIVAWEKQAESLNNYGAKGKLLYVEGRLQTRSWDGQDGKKQYRTEVVIGRWQLLEKRTDAPLNNSGGSTPPETPPDDLPF